VSNSVHLSPPTINALAHVVTGGSASARPDAPSYGPYRSGPQLIEFFRPFGATETYGQGFGARVEYAKGHLERLNGSSDMARVVEAAVDPRAFIDVKEVTDADAVEYLNMHLAHDGLTIVKVGRLYRLRRAGGHLVGPGKVSFATTDGRREVIEELQAKCADRLAEGDYPGAITASRAMLEGVLLEVERLLYPDPPPYDGNLEKLYKRVYRRVNLDPSQEGLHDATRKVLSGLVSTVAGLAPMRNKLGDAHPFEYRARRHHAELAVNSANTVVTFIEGTLTYQQEKNLLQGLPPRSP